MNSYVLRVDNKVIIVTGGYGYLGKAISNSLALHGAQVIVAAKTKEKFTKAFEESPTVHFVHVDVADISSITAAYKSVIEKYGRIDVLVNNAFYSKGQSPEVMTDEEWSYGIDGTLNTVFRTIREIIPFYKQQQSGKIINVASMYGVVAPDFSVYNESPEFLNPPHYGAAKAAVLQLTRYYASYLGKDNIQVNSVTPGAFPSATVQQDTKFMEALKSKTCLNRVGTPEDLAGVFTFLSSDAANYITGQNFIVDGGWTCR